MLEKDLELEVSLQDLANVFSDLTDQVLNIKDRSDLDLSVFTVTDTPKKEMSEEHKMKIAASARKRKKSANIKEEEDDDGL